MKSGKSSNAVVGVLIRRLLVVFHLPQVPIEYLPLCGITSTIYLLLLLFCVLAPHQLK